jgi:hypothetical protein
MYYYFLAVIAYPPMKNAVANDDAQLSCSGVSHGTRIPNPEIPGDHIKLVATNNNRA